MSASNAPQKTEDIPQALANLKEPQEHLIVEHTEQAHKRTIVIALDASKSSRYAFEWAVQNILRKDDLTILIHVREYNYTLVDDWNGSVLEALTELDDQARQASHKLLQYYGVDLKKQGYNVRAFAIRGEPREDIIRKAVDVNAHMLIMGSRGLGVIKRTLLGSVSSYIVHHSPVPVLVVRSPAEEKNNKKYEAVMPKDVKV